MLCMLIFWALSILALDFSIRKIPNILSLGGCVVGVGWLMSTGHAMTGVGAMQAMLGFGLALLLTLPGYLMHALGAGDVKLLCAIGLLCGLQITVEAFILAALLAGLVALFYWCYGRFLGSHPGPKPVPFGAALAAALIVSLLRPDYLGLSQWLA